MRRLWIAAAERFEILGWRASGKGVVWPVVVKSVSESVEIGLELIDAVRQVVSGIELVSPCRLGALDAAVEVGSFGRQNEELEAARLAFLLKDGSELAPTIDLDASDLEGRLSDEFVEETLGGLRRSAGCDLADCPFGDRIVGGEVFDGDIGPNIDDERIDLNEFAGALGLAALGQTAGITFFGGETDAPCLGPAAQDRHGDDSAARNEMR
jgi:hypothetical protein